MQAILSQQTKNVDIFKNDKSNIPSYKKEKIISPSYSTAEKSNQQNILIIKKEKEKEKIPDIKTILEENYKIIPENFEILDNIGSGSESWVNKIKHKKSKKDYALKYIFNKEKKRNINEIKIAQKLKHENVVRFFNYNYNKKDNSEIIIMENAKFGNLRNFQYKTLKRSVLSETLLCFLANEILNGLLYCHKCKIAHLDLKPQNIVIDEYLHAKLIDFSISKDYRDEKPNNKFSLSFKGTKYYMPLEVIKSKTIEYKEINKVDAYAFGVILYNLAFGMYPYDIKYDDNYDIIYEKISKNKLELNNANNSFSNHFIDFLEKLLKRDINERMSLFEAKNHYWIKGGELLYDKKKKIFNIFSFITQLIVDNIKSFNDYMAK